MGRRKESKGERAACKQRGEDGEGVWSRVVEQAGEACLGMGFQTATPEREDASSSGVREEEGDEKVFRCKQEGEGGCSCCERKDEGEDGEGSAVGVVHDAQSFSFGGSEAVDGIGEPVFVECTAEENATDDSENGAEEGGEERGCDEGDCRREDSNKNADEGCLPAVVGKPADMGFVRGEGEGGEKLKRGEHGKAGEHWYRAANSTKKQTFVC